MSGLLTASASLVEARAAGTPASVVVGLGLSCSPAGGILPGQGWNLCPLHWQADSYPPYQQGSPMSIH